MEIVSNTILYYKLTILVSLLLSLTEISIATDILLPIDTLSDGQTLVSSTQRFEFGFFSPGISKNRYLGIWYYNLTPQTVIWVANRDNPLNDSSGILKIGDHGNLLLLNQREKLVWSTNDTHQIDFSSKNVTIAQLLDSGNLVLRSDGGTEIYMWQSFDFPSDTFVAGMKLGREGKTGRERKLTSWKSPEDPSPGEFSMAIEYRGFSQVFLRKGPVKIFRTGPWDGVGFSGVKNLPKMVYNPKLINDSGKQNFEYCTPQDDSTTTKVVLSYYGSIQRQIWNNISLEWFVLRSLPSVPCDNYGQCGPNSICTINNDPRICGCLPGYEPRSSQVGEMLVSSSGCVSKHPLNCSVGEGFLELERVKIPDFLEFWINDSMSLKDCEAECLKNCSCTAYANSDPTGAQSGGCLLWFGDLVDITRLRNSGNQNFHLRVSALDLELYSESRKKRRMVLVIVAASVASVMLLIALCFILKRRLQKQGRRQDSQANDEESLELPLLSFVTISEATNNFSDSNKIGEGGFGPVYKGKLSTGQEIAVKRLSENSKQGLREFKNEVILIAKLQHRNLVRLLGCCIQGEERMLIYEYLRNGSLNSFIFDYTRSNPLAWSVRFNIIMGIARGILYLHQDSRLRIIHRDLKASNVLLDNEMNPKISDFGIARAFGGDQFLAKTRRVVGTFGYMSPEYVTNGLFSTKSDVFSFGVLLLEIVSGKRNRGFCDHGFDLSLLGHAWRLWTEGRDLELMDVMVGDLYSTLEVHRSFQIGLLCVQQRPQDRPTMSSVLSMLVSETAILPQPNQPGFYTSPNGETQHPLVGKQSTTNTISITVLTGR